jgi:hypothetical protein
MRYFFAQTGRVFGSIGMWMVGAFVWVALGLGWWGAALWRTRRIRA